MTGTHSLWADLHRPNSTPDQTTFTAIGLPYDRSASARRSPPPVSATGLIT